MLTVLYITMYNVKQSFSFIDTHFKLRELSIDKHTGIWSQLKSNTSAVKKQKTKKPSVQKHSFVSATVPSAMVTSEKRRSTTEELQF